MASVRPPTTSNTMAEVQQILCPICHKPNLSRANFCQHCGRDVMLNNDSPQRFKITEIIKEGGQGAVYKAVAVDKSGRVEGSHVYAIKEMLDRFTDPRERAEALSRFEHEADLLQRLRHPRIPRVYADFKDEGRQYLAMDFVQGEDMEEVLRRGGAIPEQQVLEWADQICDVLDYLHKNGLIYRDMKPSNIMVERQGGGVKLVDFGIAKVFQKAERGTQIGTPGYAPPEQYQGIASPESDIYALGATLHHMLTGRDPRDEPPFSFPPVYGLNPKVSQRTSAAIQKALQMKPEDRYQSVAELRAALRPEPVQPPQVRVTPKTTVLPGQPQVAAPAPSNGARRAPAVPPTPTPAPAPAPSAMAARPAAPAQVSPATVQPTTQASLKPRRGGGCVRTLLTLLLILGVGVGALVYLYPQVVDQYVPGLIGASKPVPTTYIQSPEPFKVTDLQIVVPTGTQPQEAFTQAFLQLARQDSRYGPDAIINPNAPPAFVGDPQYVGPNPDGRGAIYRATMSGYVAVPKQ